MWETAKLAYALLVGNHPYMTNRLTKPLFKFGTFGTKAKAGSGYKTLLQH